MSGAIMQANRERLRRRGRDHGLRPSPEQWYRFVLCTRRTSQITYILVVGDLSSAS
jgi:hypothetical protein